jgi:hypothetical protein
VTGFHGRAELCGHGVTVYLLPGMTRWQRQAVLRRLRMEASRGYGPALPLPQLALALAVDNVRTALRITTGAVRLHPSQTLLPSVGAVVLMAFFVLASAGGRMQFAPRVGLDGLVTGGGNAKVAAAPAPFVQRGDKPARVGPVTVRGRATVVAGLPAGQWGVKPAGIGQAGLVPDPQPQPGLRVERACFGAMPGVGSAPAGSLACKSTTPPVAGR